MHNVLVKENSYNYPTKDLKKHKTVWAYLDGKKLVDVVQAALDNDMMAADLKKKLVRENPGHEVTFRCE